MKSAAPASGCLNRNDERNLTGGDPNRHCRWIFLLSKEDFLFLLCTKTHSAASKFCKRKDDGERTGNLKFVLLPGILVTDGKV
jgi:hypothetical protein